MRDFQIRLGGLLGVIFLALAACGGSGGGKKFAGLDFEMPDALQELSLDALRVSGSVWKLDASGNPLKEISLARDAERTIRGNYALPVSGLSKGRDYEFRVQIYYQADAYAAPSLSDLKTAKAEEEEAPTPVEIENPSIALCPGLNLTPDGSLTEGGLWLKLCEVTIQAAYDPKELIPIGEADIVCADNDADGDGMANLTEIDLQVDPYDGDYDGDCVADEADAFPKDPDESVDTDEDGIGDNEDIDADNDGLEDDEETPLGTDPLKADTDDDGALDGVEVKTMGTDPLDANTDGDSVLDGSDNCPLVVNEGQEDSDGDGEGNACSDDIDNDGLTADEEAILGTDPADPDSDNDGVNDGAEVNQSTDPLKQNTDGDRYWDGPGTDAENPQPVDAFPRDPTEWADSDRDGVGDNSDICPTNPVPAGNLDTDGDRTGDACDLDDDDDGVYDTVEVEAGSNPLNPDTDGDGLEDWFGEGETVDQDPCLLDATGDHETDDDEDRFAVICDCNDDDDTRNPAEDDKPDVDGIGSTGIDNDCDGIDGDKDDAIFVDLANGNDDADGSFGNPKKTLQAGGSAAQTAGKDVYVADETYTLAETYSLPSGVMFYGGFSSGDFSARDTLGTTITSTSLDVLIEAIDTEEGTGLDGFEITNAYAFTGTTPIAVSVDGGELFLSWNTIRVVHVSHGTAIDAYEAELNLDSNVIEVNGGSNTGIGVAIDKVTGAFTGNTIAINNFASRTGISCLREGDPEDPVVLRGNTIDVWEGAAATASGLVYIRDCSMGGSALHYTIPLVGTFDGYTGFGDPLGDNVLDGLF